MKRPLIAFLIAAFWLLSSCTLLSDGSQQEPTVQRSLDTIEVRQQKAYLNHPYHPSQPRPMDLVHTKLVLEPIWEKASLEGKAILTVTPTFYPQDTVVFDAHNFNLHAVELKHDSGGSNKSLEYRYDTQKLVVQLPQTLKKGDTAKLSIKYTAQLSDLEQDQSAVAGSKGMYFINPKGEIPGKPRQIWTQGETEYASHWFPTFDRPNEKTTQEVLITVDTAFTAISNGEQVYNVTNPDGTHTVYWRQSKPHPPYLFMLAVGKYRQVKDSWRDSVPVNYYVEPEHESHARMIFGSTPEMMEYYSNVLDFDYPWAKYSQVPVRDFIAGAMENTSATIHFSRIQHNERQHLHRTYETLIAHELIHHWFGDLVTCESWANLTLNEAFATYGEHLWMRHAYGDEAAAIEWQNDLNRYMREAQRRKRPLIQYHYTSPGRLFDAHRYQKGACILRMLHAELGDKGFFAGLSHYLKENAYQPVEHHDLRLALEEVTGRDLKWFFDQWFRSAGHPELLVNKHYDSVKKQVVLTVQQEQNTTKYPVFKLPLTIGIHHQNGEVKKHEITVQDKADTFRFAASRPPHLVNFDAEKVILAKKDLRFNLDNWIYQFNYTESYLNQYEAITQLSSRLAELSPSRAERLTRKALNSPYRRIRQTGLNMTADTTQPALSAKFKDKVGSLAQNDPETRVRGQAFSTLASYDNSERFLDVFKKGLNDSSYYVTGRALGALKRTNAQLALEASNKLTETESDRLLFRVGRLQAKEGGQEVNDFLKTLLLEKPNWPFRFRFVDTYMAYLARIGPSFQEKQIPHLKKLNLWISGADDRERVQKVIKKYKERTQSELSSMKEEGSGSSDQVETRERVVKALKQLMQTFRS